MVYLFICTLFSCTCRRRMLSFNIYIFFSCFLAVFNYDFTVVFWLTFVGSLPPVTFKSQFLLPCCFVPAAVRWGKWRNRHSIEWRGRRCSVANQYNFQIKQLTNAFKMQFITDGANLHWLQIWVQVIHCILLLINLLFKFRRKKIW